MLSIILNIVSIVANAACAVFAGYGIYVLWQGRKLEKEVEAMLKEVKAGENK